MKLIYNSLILLSQMESKVKDCEKSEILPYKLACHSFINAGEDSGVRDKEWLTITAKTVARISPFLCHFPKTHSHNVT